MSNVIFTTRIAAEIESNRLYKVLHPTGTTELLYGWILLSNGTYQLMVPEDAVEAPPLLPVECPATP